MVSCYRTLLRWFVAHPWVMAWVAFGKGVVVGALITAAVRRNRERGIREGGTEDSASAARLVSSR